MNVVKLHLIFLKGAFGFFGMFYILYALYEIYQYNYERCSITAVLRLIEYSTNFCKIRKFKRSYICPSRKKENKLESSFWTLLGKLAKLLVQYCRLKQTQKFGVLYIQELIRNNLLFHFYILNFKMCKYYLSKFKGDQKSFILNFFLECILYIFPNSKFCDTRKQKIRVQYYARQIFRSHSCQDLYFFSTDVVVGNIRC